MTLIGRCVADSPIRSGRCSHTWASRSRLSARCEPRLSRATAWISSMITQRAVRSIALLRSAVSSRYSDSGVVMTKLGGLRSIAARADCVVSPDRTATRSGGGSKPMSRPMRSISASGPVRFSAMSVARAFSGET